MRHVKIHDVIAAVQHKSRELRYCTCNFLRSRNDEDQIHLVISASGLGCGCAGVVGVSRCFFCSVRSSRSALRELRRRATHLPVHSLCRAPPRGGGVAVLDGLPLPVELLREALLCVLLWARLF